MTKALLYILMVSLTASAAEPIRVFITDSQSWSMHADSLSAGGGARPQTAEVIKTFNRKCPELTVTNLVNRADYIVTLDHEGGKHIIRKDNKVAVFDRAGDVIFSQSVRMLGTAVEEACHAIREHTPAAATSSPVIKPDPVPALIEPDRDRDGGWEPFKDLKHPASPAETPKVPAKAPTKEVKLGMAFAQVEAVLGPPETRVDLGLKVLYKYKDMTIEFRDGKVADVR